MSLRPAPAFFFAPRPTPRYTEPLNSAHVAALTLAFSLGWLIGMVVR